MASDKEPMGVFIRGTLRRVAESTFAGKDGEIPSATAILDTGRDYPDRVQAFKAERTEALKVALAGAEGEVVTLRVYPKRQKNGFSLRFLERV